MQTESKRIKSFKLSTLLLPGYSRLILLFLFILAICPIPSIFASPHLGAWSADDVLLISEWRKLLGGCRTFELEDLIDIIDISTIISDIILDIGISLIWKLDISDSILAFSADINHSKQVGPLVKNSEGRSPSRGALPSKLEGYPTNMGSYRWFMIDKLVEAGELCRFSGLWHIYIELVHGVNINQPT